MRFPVNIKKIYSEKHLWTAPSEELKDRPSVTWIAMYYFKLLSYELYHIIG